MELSESGCLYEVKSEHSPFLYISNHIFNQNNVADGCPPQKYLEVMDHTHDTLKGHNKWRNKRERDRDRIALFQKG